ncbi:MAG: glycosyltransferase family 39 protein [Acidimicrobiia bacterium]|nr:glycosyltransferase family 39 protein [Acidimicrobiia bacterium]
MRTYSTLVTRQTVVRFTLWAGLAWLVLFWRLGEPTFWDPDEAHYAVTTRELLASGDWLAPMYNGRPFFDKPILFHQLQALAMLATGPTETGARLVPALSAVALIGTVLWLGRRLAGADVANVAALLLTVSPALAALARYAILDMLFTAFLFGAAALLTVAALQSRPRLEYPAYFLIALAVLTKGPLALALLGLTFLVAITVSHDARRALLALRWRSGLLVVVAVAAPWFAYMWMRFGDAFVQGYVLNENLLLFSRPPYANQPGWTFYLQIVAVGMLPWTPVLIGRLYDWTRAVVRRRAGPDALETLLWIWVGVVAAFFSASQFKLDHYVFPVAPALCLVIALAWRDVVARPTEDRYLGVRVGFTLVGPILILGGLTLAVLFITRFGLPSVAWLLPVAWIAIGGVLVAGGPRHVVRAPALTALAFGVFYLVAIGVVLPVIEQQKVVAEVARWTSTAAGASVPVCGYRLNRWNNSLLFYAGRLVSLLDSPEQFRDAAKAQGLFCLTTKEGFDELTRAGLQLNVLHEREGLWATSGRALWRTGPQLTTFVVVRTRE